MSAARNRGRGRPVEDSSQSDTSSQPASQRLQPGRFDGPASRSNTSGVGSAGRQPSTAPSATGSVQGSVQPSPAASPRPQQSGANSPARSQPQTMVGIPQPMRGDPAREVQPRYTDQLKNIDLPAIFYNVDNLVSTKKVVCWCALATTIHILAILNSSLVFALLPLEVKFLLLSFGLLLGQPI